MSSGTRPSRCRSCRLRRNRLGVETGGRSEDRDAWMGVGDGGQTEE